MKSAVTRWKYLRAVASGVVFIQREAMEDLEVQPSILSEDC